METSNGYGSLNNSTAGNRSGNDEHVNEEQPLLGQPVSKKGWREKMMANVHRDWADVVLLLCHTITGLLDSAAISTWGSFVSMQTGNTIYVGLGLAAPSESNRWIKSGASLISFCIGSFFFSRFHRWFTPSRRWVLCVSFTAQMGLIIVAAAILTCAPKSANNREEISWHVLVPIALVAFQSCGQAVTSRALKYNALTSVVLTSIYCDLFSDAELFAVQNVERNRRLAAPALLLLGAILGGLLSHNVIGTAGVLWIAAGLKFLVVISWFLWRAAED